MMIDRDSIRELKCFICNKTNLTIGIVVFTRGEYKTYCLACVKTLLNQPLRLYEGEIDTTVTPCLCLTTIKNIMPIP